MGWSKVDGRIKVEVAELREGIGNASELVGHGLLYGLVAATMQASTLEQTPREKGSKP